MGERGGWRRVLQGTACFCFGCKACSRGEREGQSKMGDEEDEEIVGKYRKEGCASYDEEIEYEDKKDRKKKVSGVWWGGSKVVGNL